MAIRHNACVNPCLSVAATGWGGGSTPTLTAVAGFSRPNAARYTAGTFLSTATGTVTAGLAYTVSAYVRSTNNSSGTIYIEWTNGTGGKSYTSTSYSLTAGTVTRLSITGTAAAGIVAAGIILDGVNYASNTTDITMVLVEQTGTLDTYFDGDSAGGTWDGTVGLSASTINDAPAFTRGLVAATGARISPAGIKGATAAVIQPTGAQIRAAGIKGATGPAPGATGATIRPAGIKGARNPGTTATGTTLTPGGIKGAQGATAQPAGAQMRAGGIKAVTRSCTLTIGAGTRATEATPGPLIVPDLAGTVQVLGRLAGTVQILGRLAGTVVIR